MAGIFATSISCIDGRIQGPVADWIKKNYTVDYVDTITEPGLDKRISDPETAEVLRKKAVISIRAHKSGLIVVSGHAECAGNPVSDEQHMECIRQAVRVAESWNLGVDVAGVWIDNTWNVSTV